MRMTFMRTRKYDETKCQVERIAALGGKTITLPNVKIPPARSPRPISCNNPLSLKCHLGVFLNIPNIPNITRIPVVKKWRIRSGKPCPAPENAPEDARRGAATSNAASEAFLKRGYSWQALVNLKRLMNHANQIRSRNAP